MPHLTTQGTPCALPDGHKHFHRTPEGLARNTAAKLEWSRKPESKEKRTHYLATHPAQRALTVRRWNAKRRGVAT